MSALLTRPLLIFTFILLLLIQSTLWLGPSLTGGQVLAFAGIDGNLYISDVTRNQTRQLTRDSAYDTDPAWSPDGQRIAYFSRENRNPTLYVIDATGRNRRSLSLESAGINRFMAWAPDNRHIVYVAPNNGLNDIFLLDVDTRAIRNLTEHPADDTEPAWSPDGSQILFTSQRAGNSDIFLLDVACEPATCEPRNITHNPAVDLLPQWSPDGTMILFLSNRDGGDFDVFVQDLNMGEPVNISANHLDDTLPQWSPSGDELLWLAPFNERYDRRVIIGNLEGQHTQTLVDQNGSIVSARWSPDGRYIAFSYAIEATRSIFFVNLRDGRWRILANGINGQSPAWRP